MARFNYLASVPESQLAELRRDETALLQPSLVLGASHFLSQGFAANPLSAVVHCAMNGGHVINDRLWHPIRGPLYHTPDEVRALKKELRQLSNEVPRYAPDDGGWTAIEFARIVHIFEHASAAGECVVSVMEAMEHIPAERKVRRLWKRPWDGSPNLRAVSRWRTFRQFGASFPEALAIVCSAVARLAIGERACQFLQRLIGRCFHPRRSPQVSPRETMSLGTTAFDFAGPAPTHGGIGEIFSRLVDTHEAPWIYRLTEEAQRVACELVQHLPSRYDVEKSVGSQRAQLQLGRRWLNCDAATRTSALGIISFHHDGYIRHEAVRQLAQIHDGSELPYLLIRQNDWVSEISREATAAVHLRLTQDYLPHFIACLPLLTRLARVRRHDLSNTVHRFVELLVQPENGALLAQVAASIDRRSRREVVRMALAKDGEHILRLVALELKSDDPVIRLWCLQKGRTCLDGPALRAGLEMLRRDRFMTIRREALLRAAELFPDSADELWRQALLDSSFSLRELAQLRVARSGQDPPAFYRDALAKNSRSWVALGGLGETGEPSDLAVIRNYLVAPLPSLRRAAIRGLARIGGDSAVRELVERLCDDAPSVTGTVRKQLVRHAPRLDAGQLYRVIHEDPREHVRLIGLQLLCELGKWVSLPWLLLAAGHADPATAAEAQRLVERWLSPQQCNRDFTSPSPEQRQAIRETTSDPSVPVTLRERVVQWMERV